MKDLLTFIGEHPWLTFFLAVIMGEIIIRTTDYLTRPFRKGEDFSSDDEDDK